jgi:hypothetical protein
MRVSFTLNSFNINRKNFKKNLKIRNIGKKLKNQKIQNVRRKSEKVSKFRSFPAISEDLATLDMHLQ